MKYQALKQERDLAIERAVEAERLSNVEVVRKLEAERDAALTQVELLTKDRDQWLDRAAQLERALWDSWKHLGVVLDARRGEL